MKPTRLFGGEQKSWYRRCFTAFLVLLLVLIELSPLALWSPPREARAGEVPAASLAQLHYHFRNDDGTEAAATSRTGGVEDLPLSTLQRNTPVRLRLGVSNEGSATSEPSAFRLEYAVATPTCALATSWSTVGSASGTFFMHDSSFLTDSTNTTDIPVSAGGVTNENSVFLTPNSGVKDMGAEVVPQVLATNHFIELEYSIVADSAATQGETYCFRVTDAGQPLATYAVYPSVTIEADVIMSTLGTPVASAAMPSSDLYLGGAFVVREVAGSRSVTSVTLTEAGTVNAATDLTNVRLYYEYDTTAPYNCESEQYDGTEAQYGSTVVAGFTGPDGTATFSGSATITPTQSLCLYPVLDVGSGVENSETVAVLVQSPVTDVIVSGGGLVSPSTPIAFAGSTVFSGAELTQTQYHFRYDDDSEAAATSRTSGVANTPLPAGAVEDESFRLRVQLTNEGAAPSATFTPRLEYGLKSTTCENIGAWTSVDSVGAAFVMANSPHLSQGAHTTNITEALGGMSDAGRTFKTVNNGVNTTSALSAASTLAVNELVELEYALLMTEAGAADVTYCFRVSNDGLPFAAYDTYAELSTSPQRDFHIQRGGLVVSGTGATLTAGVDYTAPAAASAAFIRITNTHHTGAGRVAGGGSQTADDVTVYVENPADLLTSVTFRRPSTAANTTYVQWEIIEYIGDENGDNEIIVRGHDTVTFGASMVTASSDTVTGVLDDSDVVVFITGVFSPDTSVNDFASMQTTAAWDGGAGQAMFTRGASGNDAVQVSFAVVEFTGPNWKVQRVEHTHDSVGEIETVAIAPVNHLSRAFLHTQKRTADTLQSTANFGHEVWLSSIGALSLRLDPVATTPTGHASVVWVIENTEMLNGAMNVHRVSGTTADGVSPLTLSIHIGSTLEALTSSSIFGNTRLSNTGTNYPQPIAGLTLASTTALELWRSDSGNTLTYRIEVVEWPVAALAFRQNYYRFYVDNDTLTPTDAWPPGPTELGENMSITSEDAPLAEGERVRMRMTVQVQNATLPPLQQSFKLQYGERASTCSAIGTWYDVGATNSAAAWRGYQGTPTDDAGLPSTLISVSDIAGSYESENNTALNQYTVPVGYDIEYDWAVEHNGAAERTDYCFRMVHADDTPLSHYNNYPTLRTAGYLPMISQWRWYADEENVTPTSPLAALNVTPMDIRNNNPLKLRVALAETNGASGHNVKFALQYSQYSDFADGGTTLASIGECTTTSSWCYAAGAGFDNATITEAVLPVSESCSAGSGAGCGTHNTTAETASLHHQPARSTMEFEFTVVPAGPRAGGVYYFRLFDTSNDVAVSASATPPNLMTEGPTLGFSVQGLPAETMTEGATLTASSTPTELGFGMLSFNTVQYAAHRIYVETNATEGYRVFVAADQPLSDVYGNEIESVAGTNAAPVSFTTGCGTTSCFGYHAGDDVLSGGSTRFAPDDTYAALAVDLGEIMYSAVPTEEAHDIVYAIFVSEDNPPGDYTNNISYIAVPAY